MYNRKELREYIWNNVQLTEMPISPGMLAPMKKGAYFVSKASKKAMTHALKKRALRRAAGLVR